MAEPMGLRIAKLGLAGVLGFVGVIAGSRLAGFGQSSTVSQSYVLASSGRPIEFGVAQGDTGAATQPLPPPPDGTVIQVSTNTEHVTPNEQAVVQLSQVRPRIHAITQFDGGGHAGSNCTMASGAMLLALATGILTTGSRLRTMQNDQDGGTDLFDLATAVQQLHVSFHRRSLSPHELKQVLYAGAGAVIQGEYGVLGDLRLQKNFFGGHAIYLDGYRPAENGHPDEYYVIDPIGRGWSAYTGGWMRADIVDKFGMEFSGRGVIYTSWAFPGSLNPTTYPEIPPELPGGAPGGNPRPIHKTDNPLPQNDDNDKGGKAGETQPEPPPGLPGGTTNAGTTDAVVDVDTQQCVLSKLSFCPFGIVGLLPNGATPVPIPTIRLEPIRLLYSIPVGPGVIQVIFAIPPGSTPQLSYWRTDAAVGGPLQQALDVQAGTVNGQQVGVATFPVEAGQYQFVAGATGIDLQGVSNVGLVTASG